MSLRKRKVTNNGVEDGHETPAPTKNNSKNDSKPNLITYTLNSITQFFGSLFFSIIYTLSDTKKRIGGFLVGLITIIIVVFVVSVLYNSIRKAPVIFMKLAEDQVGEADFIFSSKFTNTSTNPFLNYTYIEEKLMKDCPDTVIGIAPRWMLFGKLVNTEDNTKNTSAVFMIVDSHKEQDIGLGRTWNQRPLGRDEIHVRDGLLRALNLKANAGDQVKLSIDIMSILSVMSGQSASISQGIDSPSSGGGDFSDRNATIATLRNLLESAGFNFSATYTVNVTQVAQSLGIPIPDNIKRLLDNFGLLTQTGEQAFDLLIAFLDAAGGVPTGINMTYRVVGGIEYSGGKYPSALGNIAIIDSRYVANSLKKSILENARLKVLLETLGVLKNFENVFDNFKLEENALSIVGLYKNRFSAYLKSEKELDQEMIKLTDSIADSLGIAYPVSISLPLVSALAATKFISLFLDQIFVGVVAMLAILGIILIFALLLANVEEKSYEFGMLRALGMKQLSLIQVILIQSSYFSIPGIIIAMICAFATNAGVEALIGYVVSFPSSKLNYFSMHWIAIVIPIALGLLIPLVSNIIPIRYALSRNLRDSLDITRKSTSFSETTVRMIKLSELGLEPWQTALSVLLVVVGFVVYYVIPYTFIFQDLPLFFLILNTVLLGMLFGLCMIAVILQPFLEKLIINVILWGPERRLKTLIYKNLAGHRRRSRKTFLMFVLAVAFIIFAGVVFSLQSSNIVQNVELLVGADVSIQSFTVNYPLPEEKLKPFLESSRFNPTTNPKGVLIDHAYSTFDLKKMPVINGARFSSMAYYPTRGVQIVGLSRNYLDVAYNRYFLYTEYDKDFQSQYTWVDKKPDVIKSMYDQAGKAKVTGERPGFLPDKIYTGRPLGVSVNDSESFDVTEKYKTYIDVVISEAMRDEISVNVKSPMRLNHGTKNVKKGLYSGQDYIAKARAMIYKMPGFFYSSYRIAASGSAVLVSFDAYQKMVEKAVTSLGYEPSSNFKYLPKEKLLLKFRPDVTAIERVDMLNAVRSYLDSDFSTINDVLDVVSSTNTATTVLMGFFNIVAVIAVILCFFILTISFTSNVRENSWEFGVLRSIGLSVNKLIRAYIYEALSLVVSAFVCGTFIGVVIALTLTAQFNLFLEMPFQFAFPWPLFASIGVMAVVVAVIGSYIPARVLKTKEIAFVLRGLE